MTTTMNGHRPVITDSDDARVRVHAPETPRKADRGPVERDRSAYARVIHDRPSKVKRAHDRLSQAVTVHAEDVAAATRRTRTLTEAPTSIVDVWRHVAPAAGECPSKLGWLAGAAGGLFRACVVTAAYGLAHAVGSRLRAQVGLALFLLTVAVVAVGGHLT